MNDEPLWKRAIHWARERLRRTKSHQQSAQAVSTGQPPSNRPEIQETAAKRPDGVYPTPRAHQSAREYYHSRAEAGADVAQSQMPGLPTYGGGVRPYELFGNQVSVGEYIAAKGLEIRHYDSTTKSKLVTDVLNSPPEDRARSFSALATDISHFKPEQKHAIIDRSLELLETSGPITNVHGYASDTIAKTRSALNSLGATHESKFEKLLESRPELQDIVNRSNAWVAEANDKNIFDVISPSAKSWKTHVAQPVNGEFFPGIKAPGRMGPGENKNTARESLMNVERSRREGIGL